MTVWQNSLLDATGKCFGDLREHLTTTSVQGLLIAHGQGGHHRTCQKDLDVSIVRTRHPSPFDQQQLERAFAPLSPNHTLLVREVFSGNINTIVKVEVNEHCYGFRVRTQEKVYRYEPDLIKEAFVVWLLQPGHERLSDEKIAAAFTQ